MKAVRLKDWQQPLEIEDIPQPTPQSDEVLVRVHAAGLNPFDTALCAGYLSFMATVPLTVGTDFAGEVVAVGAGMHKFAPGGRRLRLSAARRDIRRVCHSQSPADCPQTPQPGLPAFGGLAAALHGCLANAIWALC